MDLTEKLAHFVSKTSYSNIPEAAIQQAKAGILDWFFVSLAGQKQENQAIKNFEAYILDEGGNKDSSIIGSKGKTTQSQAAMINGIIGHLLDYDETCPKVRSHLFAAIFPSLLATAESQGASGEKILESFVIGHEVSMRVGEAITPGWIEAGWHGTSLFGIFGAAMGCAKLLKLNPEQIRIALGIAASMASGIATNFGYLTKPMHAGMAAERGLTAAQMARIGFTSNPNALDGAHGFYHAYNWGKRAQESVFDRLGNPWGLETPGMSAIKLYPCCHGLCTNIEYGIRIHNKEDLKLDEIEDIEIHSQPKTLCAMLSRKYEDTGEDIQWGYKGPPRQVRTVLPVTGAQAKFSKEYAFSRALRDGSVQLKDFTDQAVNEPEIRKWMSKIRLYHNSEMEEHSKQYPEHTAPHAERMIIRRKDGRVIQEEEIFILGMTRRPLTFADVEHKYVDCGQEAGLSGEKISRIISQTNKMEQVDSMSVFMGHINS